MKQTEKIIGILIIVSMIIRLVYDYPYAAILIILLSTFLSITYFFFSFLLLNNIRLRHIFRKESYHGISTLRMLGAIASGIIFFIILSGVLFKFHNWPYGNNELIIGLGLLICVGIITTIKFMMTKALFYRNLLIRFSIIGGIGLLFLIVSYGKFIELKFRNYPDYVEAEKALLKDPYNETLIQKVREERNKMYLE